MLSINVRNYQVFFKDWASLSITKAQYELYREEIAMKKHNEFIKMLDIDTDEVVFDWRCADIKEFKQKNDWGYSVWKSVICSWWTNHPLSWYPESCKCMKEYDCLWFKMKDRLEEMWYKVQYVSEITKEMQMKYKQKYILTKNLWRLV